MEPESLGSLHPDAKPVCCALKRQDEKGRRQTCRWPFRDRPRAEHCTARSLQGTALFLPREPGTVCVSPEMTPQTTMPPTASTSHSAGSPLLSVPIRLKGSKLTEQNTQHLGKYSGNNISFLLETKTKEGSPELYVVTNNSSCFSPWCILLTCWPRALIFKWPSAFASRKRSVARI